MSSRVVGAGLALIAAAMLAVSIATPAVLPAGLSLFAGHPTVKDHTRSSQNVYVGLYSAQLCNNGDEGSAERGGELTCKSGDAKGMFRFVGFGELGATGLGAFSLVLLAALTLKKSEGRKGAARVVRIVNVVGVAGAIGMIAVKPFGSDAAIPIGLGMLVHVAGLIAGIVASAIAVRPPPPLVLRVAERASKPVVPVQAPIPAFDMQAVFGDEPRRAELGPDPGASSRMRGRRTEPPPHAQEPAAPQLRPLYDATPMQGGTGGLMPFERPVLSMRAPTPVPRAMFEVDIDVEPSMIAPLPSMPAPSPPAPVLQQPYAEPPPNPERSKSRSLPPPSPPPRSKPMSIPPPMPAGPPSRSQPVFAPAAEPMADLPAHRPSQLSAQMADQGDHELSVAAAPLAAPQLFPRQPAVSDGRPEALGSSPNTEPTMFPHLETPIAAPPRPSASHAPLEDDPFEAAFGSQSALPVAGEPAPGPTAGTVTFAAPPPPTHTPPPAGLAAGSPSASLAAVSPSASLAPTAPSPQPPAPLPIAPPSGPRSAPRDTQLPPPRAQRDTQLPPPRAQRDTQLPPPRAQRDSQVPRPGLRASVPMPARPNRPTMPTRPPPIAMRGAPPKSTIAAPVVPPPMIPPIPAIPMPARGDAAIDQATGSRVPIEISDNASQTNVSEIPVDDGGTAPVQLQDAGELGDDTDDAERAAAGLDPLVRAPDTSPTGEPIGQLAAPAASAVHAAQAAQTAAREPTATAFPVPLAFPAPTPAVRDRPAPKLPISTAPDSLPPPKDTKQQAGPSPACPQCESPMAWVEEHLRFYCKSCRMYF